MRVISKRTFALLYFISGQATINLYKKNKIAFDNHFKTLTFKKICLVDLKSTNKPVIFFSNILSFPILYKRKGPVST